MSSLRACTVYCGSSPGTKPEYRQTAELVGRLLAERGVELVYGGGQRGCMGAVADGALGAGGRVVGIIPQFMSDLEWQHKGCSELDVVDTMHTRKQRMLARGDAILALPGGVGTLEELLEALEWTCAGRQRKPVAVLNTDGLYTPLLEQLQSAVRQGLEGEACLELLVSEDPAELVAKIERAVAFVATSNDPVRAPSPPKASEGPVLPPAEGAPADVAGRLGGATAVLVDDRPNNSWSGFCGAAGESLARLLVEEGSEVVIGSGAPRGSAAWAVAEATVQAGGRVLGLAEAPGVGTEHPGLAALEVVAARPGEHSLHARKRRLLERSSRVVLLPGGLACWEEFLDAVSGAQLEQHSLPLGILNVGGYYDPLLRTLECTAQAGFTQPEFLSYVVHSDTPKGLLQKLRDYSPARASKVTLHNSSAVSN